MVFTLKPTLLDQPTGRNLDLSFRSGIRRDFRELLFQFLKMLCRHNMDAVIEVLLFTLARHLIISQSNMFDSLLCIFAIAVLFVVRKFLFVPQVDKGWSGGNDTPPDSCDKG